MIFKDEVRNVDELVAKLIDIDSLKKIKVAVICFIFNKQCQVILNRRGPGARDDVGKLQAVGGSVNKSDADFLSALKREILEETGNNDININPEELSLSTSEFIKEIKRMK